MTTASSSQRSRPHQSQDGGSSGGFSYGSVSSRSERRLREQLPRQVTSSASRSMASGSSQEMIRDYHGPRRSLASSASASYCSERTNLLSESLPSERAPQSPRYHSPRSPRGSFSGSYGNQ